MTVFLIYREGLQVDVQAVRTGRLAVSRETKAANLYAPDPLQTFTLPSCDAWTDIETVLLSPISSFDSTR